MKRKKSISYIKLMGDNKEIIFDGKLTSLTIDEDLILIKCKEFFNDDSPCYIHRSAAMKRMFIEIENFFNKHLEKVFIFDNLPLNIKEIFKQYKAVYYVEFYVL